MAGSWDLELIPMGFSDGRTHVRRNLEINRMQGFELAPATDKVADSAGESRSQAHINEPGQRDGIQENFQLLNFRHPSLLSNY